MLITNHSRRTSLVAAVVALASFAGVASAAPTASTAWSTPSGSQTDFSYSSGQTLNSKFGSGNSTGSGFYFTPAGFTASAAGSFETFTSNHASTSDTVSVILNAKPLTQFGSISASFLGDYVTDGFASTNATGQLRVYNLDNLSAGPQIADLDFGSFNLGGGTIPNAGFGNSQGGFNGTADLALPDGWTNIRVELDGMVSADALFGSSVIQAKDASIDVMTAPLSNTTEIPLPAAVFAAPVAGVVGLKLRRKLIRR